MYLPPSISKDLLVGYTVSDSIRGFGEDGEEVDIAFIEHESGMIDEVTIGHGHEEIEGTGS